MVIYIVEFEEKLMVGVGVIWNGVKCWGFCYGGIIGDVVIVYWDDLKYLGGFFVLYICIIVCFIIYIDFIVWRK